jgi:hypothetical protein
MPRWQRATIDFLGLFAVSVIAIYFGDVFPGHKLIVGGVCGYIWGATMWWRWAWINANN